MRAIGITLVLKDYQSDKKFRNIAADIFNRLPRNIRDEKILIILENFVGFTFRLPLVWLDFNYYSIPISFFFTHTSVYMLLWF